MKNLKLRKRKICAIEIMYSTNQYTHYIHSIQDICLMSVFFSIFTHGGISVFCCVYVNRKKKKTGDVLSERKKMCIVCTIMLSYLIRTYAIPFHSVYNTPHHRLIAKPYTNKSYVFIELKKKSAYFHCALCVCTVYAFLNECLLISCMYVVHIVPYAYKLNDIQSFMQ